MRPLLSADRLAIAGAALLALAVPALLLQPASHPISLPADTTVTTFRSMVVEPLGAALETPLFNRERSPLPPQETAAPDAAAEAPPPAPPPVLVGTIARHRGGGLALIKNAAGETVMLRIGEEVDGWRIVSVGESEALLDQNGRRESVLLDFRNKTAAAGAIATDTSADNIPPLGGTAGSGPMTPPGGPTG